MKRILIHHHGARKTSDINKIRKDIRVRDATNKTKASQAIRYFDACANELSITNADMFVKVMAVYSQATKFKPKRINFRKNKK